MVIPRKLVEAVFRRLWLLAIPIVVAPALVLMMVEASPMYRSTATVWVSRPANLQAGSLGAGTNAFQSPADAQVQVFKDLLNTRAFSQAVGTAVGLSADSAIEIVPREVAVVSAGNNLIAIVVTSPSGDRAQKLAAAVISQYQARAASESQRQTDIAVQYYTKQIDVARTELDTRRAAVTTYVQAHPVAADGKTVDTAYLALQSSVESQTKVVDSLIASLQDAQRTAASAPQSLEASFNVQDAPSKADTALAESKGKKLGYPFAALVFGLLISGTYVYVKFRTDHAIRSTEDLVGLPVPLLGFVPDIQDSSRGARLARWTKVWHRRSDYARAVAASISRTPARQGGIR